MVASPLNLYLLPSLSTKNDYASVPSAASTAATATSINSIGQGQPLSRPDTSRPRRKKMASIGVEAMRNMIMTTTTDDSSTSATTTPSSTAADAATAVAVSIPASPSIFEHEREDMINRSTNNQTILSIPVSAPLMPLMPDLTIPTPVTTAIRRSNTSSSVFPRRRVNNNKRIELSNAQLPVPVPTLPTKTKMKKAKSKQVLRQIKRGLLLEFISSKHQQHEEGCGCSSGRTSTTVSTSTSTSSLLMATPQSESESFVDEITTPTIMLAPRFRMFHEDVEEQEQQEQVTMIKPAAPWSTQLPSLLSSSSSKQVVAPTTTITQPTPSLLSASLNKALSVLAVSSSNDDDDNDDDNDNDWGIFVSFGDDEDEKEHDREREYNNNYDCYSPLSNRSYLPVFAEGLWIQ